MTWEGHGKTHVFLHNSDVIHCSCLIFVSGLHLQQDNPWCLGTVLGGATASLASAAQEHEGETLVQALT